jgi:tetrahydromethanopterin S-methyltransferase subunit F
MTTVQANIDAPANQIPSVSAEITGLKAGLLTCVSLIIYFLIMKLFNFMSSPIAWAFNLAILGTGIVLVFEYYRMKTTLNVDYIPGLILGSITTAVSVIPFAFFIYVFFSQSDPIVLNVLKENVLFMGEQITPTRAAFATAIEGLCSGVLITFILMQYLRSGFRRKRNEKRMHG